MTIVRFDTKQLTHLRGSALVVGPGTCCGIILIRKGDEGRFARVHPLTDWHYPGLTIGQRRYLPAQDERSQDCSRQFVGGFVQHAAQAACATSSEHKPHPDLNIESHLVFRYPLALLFFILPKYPELAQRIELGLQRVRQSGVLERFVGEGVGSSIRRLKLDNPDLPASCRAMMADVVSSSAQ